MAEPIIKKIGEGRTVAHIPIEINTSKLLDWLVDRKIVPVQWTKSYAAIRTRFPTILQEISDVAEVQALGLSTDSLNYWMVQRVIEILKTTNGGKEAAKNFFGQYTSKRMSDWDSLQRSYEKDNIYLAESAQFIGTAVNYELPALRKTVDKYTRQLAESQRKEVELLRTIELYKNKYASACRELNIEGKDVKSEIQAIASQLGALFEEFAKLAQHPGIKRAVDYYVLFVRYAQGQTNPDAAAKWPVCEMLQSVHEHGNEPVRNYIARKYPHLKPAAAPAVTVKSQETEEAPSEIKWDVDEEPKPQIDWGDLGISVAASGEASASAGQESAPLTIAWIEEAAEEPIQVHVEEKPAGGSEEDSLRELLNSNETVMDNNEMRNRLLGDAIELDAFFKRRIDEMDNKDALAMSQLQYAPVEIQQETKETIAELAAPVRKLLTALDADRVHRLLEIRNSKRYVERLTASIKHHLQVAEKLEKSVEELHVKRKETETLLQEQYPPLEALQGRVKEVRTKVEAALSKLYDNRTVTLYDG